MINCVYCGGSHDQPADVKQCWQRAQFDGTPGPSAAAGAVSQPTAVAPSVSREPLSTSSTTRPAAVVGAKRGPVTLGRHVIVAPGQEPPAEWSDVTARLHLDQATVSDPSSALAVLSAAGAARTSLVIELADDVDLAVPGASGTIERRQPFEVGVGFAFQNDDLADLIFANAVDARDPDTASWVLLDQAVAAGARPTDPGEPGDIVTPNGDTVWLDGGPIRHLAPVDGVPVLHAVQVEHNSWRLPQPNVTSAALAPDQLAAVLHDGGAARIIAPAGSGKTRVLTERARQLLRVWNVPPRALTLVAFNKRAQEEMMARTSDLRGLQVRTLNAIGLAIVNGQAPFAPQPRKWRTIDERETRDILQRFITVPRRRNTDPLAPWIEALSLVRLGLLDPALVEARYDGDVDGLPQVWEHYRQALERESAVDFDDQIARAIEVLLTQPEARRVAQRACRMLLVDEFQDLTPAHLLLIRLLAAPGGAVFGVGDDDQTIYGYNGADPAWLIDFATWFPTAGDHPLQVNYRCPGGVVDIADRLVRHNRRRVQKVIRAASPEPGGWSVEAGDDPVEATVNAVSAALAAGTAASDIAVLTRVNATIAPVQVALTMGGIPFAGGVGTEFCERTSVRSALAWLRLSSGKKFRPEDVQEALRRPSRPLHPKIGDWVAEQTDVESLLRLSSRLTNDKDAARVGEFAADIGQLTGLRATRASTERLLSVLIDDIGLGGAVATLDNTRVGMNRASQRDDLIALRQLGRLQPDPARFESWLRDQLSAPRNDSGVVLATVHRVKGQEWPQVIVHLADAEQFPHRLAEDVEEERRLFHVAITRASQHVTLVCGDRPSPFIAELTTEPSPDAPAVETATRASSRLSPTPATRGAKSGADRDHPLLDRDRVLAAVGLVLVDQGHEWTIIELEPAAAVAERNGATRRFALGERVETLGRQRGPLTPRPGNVNDASVRLFDALRSFRDRVRAGKPAYTVFDDKTLAAISDAVPTDLPELARVKGVGPAKLEQYGDEVLQLAAAVLTVD